MRNYQAELDNYIKALADKPRLALHSCCAPCSSYVLEYLTEFFNVTLFYHNPNVHPRAEYEKRLSEQRRICEVFGVPLVECDYDPADFFSAVRGLENEPEGGARCEKCFELRLRHTARLAAEQGIPLLCTTLTISPHKNAPLINAVGERAAAEYGLEWLPCDFKKRGGYQRSIELCRQYDVYRQHYCGCVYSIEKTPVQQRLFALADYDYRDFTAKLIPNVDPTAVIGVRSPALKSLARELRGTEFEKQLLSELPHAFYEENNLHAQLISRIKDPDELLAHIERFLPYIDNWATCDSLRPSAFKKRPHQLMPRVKAWLRSDHSYTVRFAMGMLASYYLDEGFEPAQLALVANAVTDEYYVKMMAAWYFATALAKQYEAALPYIENKKLDKWTHNKAIQKSLESYRVPEDHKIYLKSLKIK